MASAPAWRPWAAAGFWPTAAPRAASACRPESAILRTGAPVTDVDAGAGPSRGTASPGHRGPGGTTGPAAIRRLLTRRDFLRVAAHQTKAVTPGLILQAAPTPPATGPSQEEAGPAASSCPKDMVTDSGAPLVRVGFTVSKKVGNAVRRNRARRRLRAAVDAVLADLAAPGTDYVVIGRAATVERTFDDLLNDLRSAVNRIGTPPARRPAASGPQRRSGRGGGRGSGRPSQRPGPAPSVPQPNSGAQ